MHVKFDICNFIRSRDIKGSQNLKFRSCDLGYATFLPIFHFFDLVSLTFNSHAKFEVFIFSHSRDIRGPKIYVTQGSLLCDLIFFYF